MLTYSRYIDARKGIKSPTLFVVPLDAQGDFNDRAFKIVGSKEVARLGWDEFHVELSAVLTDDVASMLKTNLVHVFINDQYGRQVKDLGVFKLTPHDGTTD